MAIDFAAVQIVAPRTDPMLADLVAGHRPAGRADGRPSPRLPRRRRPGDRHGRRPQPAARLQRREDLSPRRRRPADRADRSAAARPTAAQGWRLHDAEVRPLRRDERPRAARPPRWPGPRNLAARRRAGAVRRRQTPSRRRRRPAAPCAAAAANARRATTRPALQRRSPEPLGDRWSCCCWPRPSPWPTSAAARARCCIAGGLAAGLLFLVVDGLLTALGEGGALSPVLAVWARAGDLRRPGASTRSLTLEG